jgi:hypothetical protein
MSFLTAQDKVYFEEFWTWASKGKYVSDETKHLAHQILFDQYLGDNSEYNCRTDCSSCPMYSKTRCAGMRGYSSYRRGKAEDNEQKSAGDYNYYKSKNERIIRNMNELCLVLGTYRVKKFQEHIYNKGMISANLHNKLNPKHKVEELKDQDPVYFSSSDLMAMDTWLLFKNEKYQGDFLCSLLSDL